MPACFGLNPVTQYRKCALWSCNLGIFNSKLPASPHLGNWACFLTHMLGLTLFDFFSFLLLKLREQIHPDELV